MYLLLTLSYSLGLLVEIVIVHVDVSHCGVFELLY